MKRRNNIMTYQGSVQNTGYFNQYNRSFQAEVTAVNSKNNTCTLKANDGSELQRIPVRTVAGLINDEVYGVLDMPCVGDRVIVDFIGDIKVITGVMVPYLADKFQTGQTPVNSASKQFTLKLLEEGKEKFYKKIFKGGTTLEVQDDGTIIVETPSGAYIQFDEAGTAITLEDSHGNTFVMNSSGVAINGTNLEVDL